MKMIMETYDNFITAVEELGYKAYKYNYDALKELPENSYSLIKFFYIADYNRFEYFNVTPDAEVTVDYFKEMIKKRRLYTLANDLMKL